MNPSREDMLQRPEYTLNFSGFGIDFRAHHRGRTLRCPICGIDAVVGDDIKLPIEDLEFVQACCKDWFAGKEIGELYKID